MNDSQLPAPLSPVGQLLIYRDGGLNLRVRIDDQAVWLTQAQMAELFQTTPQNITIHTKGIYEEGEQTEAATCKEYLQVRLEGGRQVQRVLKHYSLDMGWTMTGRKPRQGYRRGAPIVPQLVGQIGTQPPGGVVHPLPGQMVAGDGVCRSCRTVPT